MKEVFFMTLGERLAKIRKENNYRQKDLSVILNVSQQVISNIERNLTAPDIELLKAVADVYKTSLDNLVGRKNEYEDESGDDITRQIVDVIEEMDDDEKKLCLDLVNRVYSYHCKIQKKDIHNV